MGAFEGKNLKNSEKQWKTMKLDKLSILMNLSHNNLNYI